MSAATSAETVGICKSPAMKEEEVPEVTAVTEEEDVL